MGQRGRGLHTWGALARATGRAIAFEPCFKKKKRKKKKQKAKTKENRVHGSHGGSFGSFFERSPFGVAWYSVLQCAAVCCRLLHAVQSGAVWCSAVQCVAVCCGVLQCVAVCCSVLQCVMPQRVSK